MVKLQIDGSVFNLYSIEEALQLKESSFPLYVYGKYGKDLLTGLHLLQSKTQVVYAGISFKNDEIDKVLRHINIYGTYTFGLYPESYDFNVFEKIYDFFLYSNLSSVYIAWFSSLMLKPNRGNVVSVNDRVIFLPECGECFLKTKGCCKAVIFPDVFHPDNGLPSFEVLDTYCGIVRYFSQRIADDVFSFSDKDMDSFEKTRQSLGIKNQYWLDPFMIYG